MIVHYTGFAVCSLYSITFLDLIPPISGANIVNLILLYALPKSLITLAGVPYAILPLSEQSTDNN